MKKMMAGLTACAMLAGCMICFPAAAEETTGTEGTYESLTYMNYGDYIEITGCDTAVTEVVVPSEIDGTPVTIIGDNAFYSCTQLTSIVFSEGITTLGEYALSWCESLTSIALPDSLTTIEMSAFTWCKALEEITYPANLESLSPHALGWNYALTNIYVSQDNPYFTSIDGVLYSKDGKTLRNYPIGRTDTSYTTMEGVEVIGEVAFSDCPALEHVTISEGVTAIEGSAFTSCTNLASVTLPDSLISLDSAFSYTALTEITLPANVESLNHQEFHFTETLTAIYVSEDNPYYKSVDGVLLTKDGKKIVSYPIARAATSYVIPDSVETLDQYTFWGCAYLQEVTIPAGITAINEEFDLLARSFTALHVDSENPSYSSIDGVLFDKTGETLLCYPAAKPATEYTIPEGTVTVGDGAFYFNSYVTTVTISEGVEILSAESFNLCNSLTQVNMASTVKTIKEWTFSNSSKLEEITLPEGLTELGSGAFFSCSALTSITVPEQITKINLFTFKKCTGLTEVYLPAGLTTIDYSAFEECTALTDVYFAGTEEQWNAITIQSGNDPLLNATIHFGSAASVYNPGDVNLDAGVSIVDVVFLNKAVMGAETLTAEQETAADCDHDGEVTAADSLMILKSLVDLVTLA